MPDQPASINERIRLELDTPSTPEDLDRVWLHVQRSIDAAGSAPRVRGRLRHARGLALAAAVLLSIGGIAAAAETGIVERVFGDDDPVVERVDQFADRDAEQVTPKEYETLEGMTLVPAVKRIGTLRDDEMKQLYELAPIEQSRVVVDDPEVGRLVAVPTTDGTTICQLYSPPGSTGASSGGCTIQFDQLGLNTSWSMAVAEPPFPASRIFGLASDDVDRIEVEFSDGRREGVTLKDNVFLWTAEPGEDNQIAIHTWRGSRHVRVTNLCLMQPTVHDC
ncbi:MAG: hypothetical protein KDC46_08685 [Thermoleophilia bacterium]|nr:hypothetical protein [Thermoleophilia bacterium]